MTTTTGVGATDPNQATTVLPAKKALSTDDFIKLFLKQMTTQNPMKPADSSSILQQMSEISSIQASKDMQTSLTGFTNDMKVTMGNSELMSATQLVGRNVMVDSNNVAPLVEGKGLAGTLSAPPGADNISITIKDPSGMPVKTISLGSSTDGGLKDFSWDGKIVDPKTGEVTSTAKPGYYTMAATCTYKGNSKPLPTAGAFEVKSVALDPTKGALYLNLDYLGGTSMDKIIKYL